VSRQSRKLRSAVQAHLLVVTVCLITTASLPVLVTPGVRAAPNESDNLLRNPGFDDGDQGRPEGWAHFLAPADGAEAVWDETVHRSGKRSVMLHTENPYDQEVYNNWYQHVATVPPGRKLILSGYIRSNKVTDAAMWLQCWDESSQVLLRLVTTSLGYPICGTGDWTYVQTSVTPPPETAFVTVRCVIAGTGTAWFDDLRLAAQQEHESDSLSKGTDEHVTSAHQEPLDELVEAHKELLEVNKKLADNVRLIMEEIGRIRDDLNQLKKSIETAPPAKSDKEDYTTSQPSPVPPFRPAARYKRGSSRVETSP
jgi:hypothetical protein